MKITLKQLRILTEIVKFVSIHGHAPSIRELCKITGVRSTCTMHGYLMRLKERGFVDWEPNLTRTLQVKGSR